MGDQSPKASGTARLKGADEILRSWHRFNGIYKDKRYIIENRWFKMKQERRRKFLGECWSTDIGLPENHRPDLDGPAVWRRKGTGSLCLPWPLPAMPQRLHALMPDFNKTDLGDNPVALLHLLETRAVMHPGDFSGVDKATHYNVHLRDHFKFDVEELDATKWTDEMKGTLFAYTGSPYKDDDPEEYGSIVEINDPTHMETLQSAGYMSSEEAALVIEIETYIYSFLERICDNITVDDKSKGWPLKDESKQTVWRRNSGFDSTKREQTEAFGTYLEDQRSMVPYTSPYDIDFEYLTSLSGLYYRQSLDMFRNLKEDPEFFYTYMWEFRQHSPHQVYDQSNNFRHPWRDVDDNPEAWASTFKLCLGNLIKTCDLWRTIYSHIEKQRKMIDDLKSTPRELLRSSEDYQAHTLGILHSLASYVNEIGQVAVMVKCSDQFRDMYRIRTNMEYNGETGKMEEYSFIDQHVNAKKPKTERERFIAALLRANDVMESFQVFRPWTILDEMSSRLLEDKKISYLILDYLKQLNAGSSIMDIVMRSWIGETALQTTEEIPVFCASQEGFNRTTRLDHTPGSDLEKIFREIMTSTSDKGSQKIVGLGTKFQHSTKPRAKAKKTERTKAIEAEDNLKEFWEKAERLLLSKGCLPDSVRDALQSVTPLNSYPEDRDKKDAPVPAAPSPAAPAVPFVPLPAAAAADYTARRVSRTLVDVGNATMRTGAQGTEQSEDVPEEEEEGPDWPKIKLAPANYATVDLLMGTSSDARPGEVAWDDISRLLNAIGFRGPQVHPGAARFFEPSDELRKDQGITQALGLHEPHGRDMATNAARIWARSRRYGLAKFGWDIDHFVEEDD